MQPIGGDQRLVGVLVAAELLVRGREPAVQIGDRARRAPPRAWCRRGSRAGMPRGRSSARRRRRSRRARRSRAGDRGRVPSASSRRRSEAGVDAGGARQRRELGDAAAPSRVASAIRPRAASRAGASQRRGRRPSRQPGERPGRVGVIRAEREHALVGGLRGRECRRPATGARRPPPSARRSACPRRSRRRPRAAWPRRTRGDPRRATASCATQRERGRVLGHQRERGLDRLASTIAIVELSMPDLREPDVERGEIALLRPLGAGSAGFFAPRPGAGFGCSSSAGAVATSSLSVAIRPSRIAAASRSRPALTSAAPADRRAPGSSGADRARVAQRRGRLLGRVQPLEQDAARGATAAGRAPPGSRVERGAPAQHVGRARSTGRCAWYSRSSAAHASSSSGHVAISWLYASIARSGSSSSCS